MVVMRIGLLAVSLVGLLAAQDAREIVLKAVEVDRAQLDLARQYTFVQRVENRELDDAGAVKKVESKTFDVLSLEGTFYERLIARDDKPLSAQDECKEKEKFERNLAKRKAETPSQRAKRIAEEEKEQRELRDQLRQIPDAFDLRIAGEEAISGRTAWVIEATPRQGFRGKGRLAQMFPKMRGRLWISQGDFRWVKVEAESLDTISLGWVLARVHKGTRFYFEQMRVNDEVWLPKEAGATFSGRLALVKKLHRGFTITFSNYRKFQTDSRVLDVSETQESR